VLIYLHGFNSSPQSTKATLFGRYMAARGLGAHFACPALPHQPDQALAAIEAELVRSTKSPVTLIGSSLGGFYATWFAEKHGLRAVLINPAVCPHRDLRAYLGVQQNLYTGKTYELTQAHIARWAQLFVPVITPSQYLLLVETGDEVLDYREAVEKYAGAQQVVEQGGDHSFMRFSDHIEQILAFAGLAVEAPSRRP